jgi:hypothetical protein
VIADSAGSAEVMRASIALTRLMAAVRFTSLPSLGVEEFDRLFGA